MQQNRNDKPGAVAGERHVRRAFEQIPNQLELVQRLPDIPCAFKRPR
jgi:hypothetical protein